jgi:L-arabinose transport system permease protein
MSRTAGTPTTPLPAVPTRRSRALILVKYLWETTGMLPVLVLLVLLFCKFVPFFGSLDNLRTVLLSMTTVGIVACMMLFCMAAGDFDLSCGSITAMSGVLSATICNWVDGYVQDPPEKLAKLLSVLHLSDSTWLSVILSIIVGTLAGGCVGAFNGFLIAGVGINALIITLGTMQIARGLDFVFCNGVSVGVSNPSFYVIGISQTHIWGKLFIPWPVWIMFGSFIIFGILLNRTTFGRNTLAIGGNGEAARLAGVKTVRTKILIFTMLGMLAGFAGTIQASQFTSGQPNTGVGLELDVISACVLGGVSLTGGIGTMLGVVVGVTIMGVVNDAMNLEGIDPLRQYIVRGSVLIAAVLIDKFKQWLAQ